MRKRVFLALMLVLALLAATGCSQVANEKAADPQAPAAEVLGKTITHGDVNAQTEYLLDYYEYMYSMYGMTFDRTNAEIAASAREAALESLIQNVVIEAKVTEKGLDQFTAEEEAEMAASVEESYKNYSDFIKGYMFSDSELTGDELQAEIDKQMVAMGYGSKEEMLQNERLNRANNKLIDEIIKDVTVSEDEIVAQYNKYLENDKTVYTSSPASYGNDLSNGITPYYAPAGYRNVKHILLAFSAEDQDAIDELNSQIASAEEADVAALQEQLDAATEKAYAALQPAIDEINARLAAGESFESLITEYNEDPGMTADSVGYAVSADSVNWVQSFTDGSMALANVGDVSEPVRSSYGIHIIQYASDIPEGEVGLENVRAELEAELLMTKQDAKFAEVVQQWVNEAKPKKF